MSEIKPAPTVPPSDARGPQGESVFTDQVIDDLEMIAADRAPIEEVDAARQRILQNPAVASAIRDFSPEELTELLGVTDEDARLNLELLRNDLRNAASGGTAQRGLNRTSEYDGKPSPNKELAWLTRGGKSQRL